MPEAAEDPCLEAKIALADAKRAYREAEQSASHLGYERMEAEEYLKALREQLPVAEAAFAAVTSRYEQAQRRSGEAAERVKELKARVRELATK